MVHAKILRIVVASPNDVQQERDMLDNVVAEVNRGVAADRGLRLEVVRWETDAHPGFDPEGPQGLIDPVLRITDCDFLIGIFWKRFGTPTSDAESGTEHEIQMAYESWKRSGIPQILIYFNERSAAPRSSTEADQWARVLRFKENFPKEGLWWAYKGPAQFERLIRNHLTRYVRDRFSLLDDESRKDTNDNVVKRATDRPNSAGEDIAIRPVATRQPAPRPAAPVETKPRPWVVHEMERRSKPQYLVGDEDTASAAMSPHEQSLRALGDALKRIVPSIFRDPRIRDETLDDANRALLSINPLIKALSMAAKEETDRSIRYDLQQLNYVLRKHQTTVSEMLSALGQLRSEKAAKSPCAALAKEAASLLATGDRSICYVT